MRPEDKLEGQTIQAAGSGSAELVREEDKIHLVLSYLGLLSLVPLLTVKDSPYVQWHAKNGLVLGIGAPIVLGIAYAIISSILMYIPVIGWILAPLLGCGLVVGLLGANILCMVKALNGVRYRVPVLTDLAEKL